MPEVQIRPAVSTDLSTLMSFDHSCQTEYVWQVDILREEGQTGVNFRPIRLPRTVTVEYPRPVSALSESWSRRSGMLVAVLADQMAGYVRMSDSILPRVVWITDVVVAPRFRRKGIAATLILAAQSWAVDRQDGRAMIEMPSKNNPAIQLAQKLGYEFCGYNDQYYPTQDVALFFGRALK